jgi:hypothetical protein
MNTRCIRFHAMLLLGSIGCSGDIAKDDDDDDDDDTAAEGDDDTGVDSEEVDQDGDGWQDNEDCGPTNPAIYPGAPEFCDGRDSNCDGDRSDSGVASTLQFGELTDATDAMSGGTGAGLEGLILLCPGHWTIPADIPTDTTGSFRGELSPDAVFLTANGSSPLGSLHAESLVLDGVDITLAEGGTFILNEVQAHDVTVRLPGRGTVLIRDSVVTSDVFVVGRPIEEDGPIARTEIDIEDSTITTSGVSVLGIDDVTIINSTVVSTTADTLSDIGDARLSESVIEAADIAVDALGDLRVLSSTIIAGDANFRMAPGTELLVDGGALAGARVGDFVDVEVTFRGGPDTTGLTGSFLSFSGESVHPHLVVTGVNLSSDEETGRWLQLSGTYSATIEDSTFHDNDYGAVLATGEGPATLTLSSVGFLRNGGGDSGPPESAGGDLALAQDELDTTATDTTFIRSQVSGAGGAVLLTAGTLTTTGVTYQYGRGASGGAVAIAGGSYASLGDSFDSNTATGDGGSVHISSGSASFANVSMLRSQATHGGALYAATQFSVGGSWDFGEGSNANSPDDVYLEDWGSSWSLGSGTAGFSCGATDSCGP